MGFSIGYITFASRNDAEDVSGKVVQEHLAACANIFPITSQYWWQGELNSDDEWVAIVKTTNERWPELAARIEDLHPYDVPCIMRLQVSANPSYEEWIERETKREPQM